MRKESFQVVGCILNFFLLNTLPPLDLPAEICFNEM